MSYTILKGSHVVAVRHDGKHEAKEITKERIYAEAIVDGDWLIFPIKPGAAWKEFRAKREDVTKTVDILGVPDGTYDLGTIVIKLEVDTNPKSGKKKNFFFGKQIVSYSENHDEFVPIAHIDETGAVHIWKKYRRMKAVITRVKNAVAQIQEGINEA